MFERIARWVNTPSLAYWPLTVVVLMLCITYLLSTGHIREVLVNWGGGHALLGKGDREDWKNLVAELVNKSDVPLTREVGLFLHINDQSNIDGQAARNVVEICAAIIYAKSNGKDTSGACSDADFSRTKMALLELKDFGFIESVQFFKVPYLSYKLNTLGNRAFERVRRKAATESADLLALLDFDRAGLRAPVVRARASYAEALAGDRGGVEGGPR